MFFGNRVDEIASSKCYNDIHIQLVQVQDSTSSFADDWVEFPVLFEQLIAELRQTYSKVSVALSGFTDKPNVYSGTGVNSGIWDEDRFEGAGFETDYCYKPILTLDQDEDISTAYNRLHIGGGKDDMENQWDALLRSVHDPDMGWHDLKTGEFDEDGYALVKIAMLVTDAPAHRNSPQIDFAPENRNWYYEETNRGPCGYNDDTCLGVHGDAASKSGAFRSLGGMLDHYDSMFAKNESERYFQHEAYGWEHNDLLNEYRFCCTDAYNQWPFNYVASCDTFVSYDVCAEASCPHCSSCAEKDICVQDPNHMDDWFAEAMLKDATIYEYPYDASLFDNPEHPSSCSQLEYPDPFSAQYAQGFLDKGIVPMFIIRSPQTQIQHFDGPYYFSSDDLFKSAHICPNLEQDLAKYFNCMNTTYQQDDGISAHGGCDDFVASDWDDLSTYNDACIKADYEPVIQSLESYGVPYHVHWLPGQSDTSDLLVAIFEAIFEAIENSPLCLAPETTEDIVIVPTVPPTTAPTESTEGSATDSSSTGESHTTTEESSLTGVFIGVAGGVGSAAAAAGTLFALKGKSSVSSPDIVEDVEVDEDLVEREAAVELNLRDYA